MVFEFLKKIIFKLIKKEYVVVKKEDEGIIKDGKFMPYDFNSYIVVDKTKNLILEKGRYKILPRNCNQIGPNDPVGMFVIDNAYDSYNKFWGNEEIIANYLCEERVKFFNEAFNLCKKYLKGKIIDIWCGSGDFLKIIKENNIDCEIYGFDFSISAIRRCQRTILSGKFLVGDIYNMEYIDNSFDVVICMEVLEHLEKPEFALKEIRRIGKKNGIVIITIPNGAYDDYIGHINFWTECEFKEFLGDIAPIDFQYLENKRTMLFILQNQS